jgi:hypothetical protein
LLDGRGRSCNTGFAAALVRVSGTMETGFAS